MKKILLTMAVILAARMAFASTIPVVTSYLSSTQIDNLTYDGVLKAKKVSVISSTATPLNVTIVSPTTYPLPTAQVSDLKSVSLSTSLPCGWLERNVCRREVYFKSFERDGWENYRRDILVYLRF